MASLPSLSVATTLAKLEPDIRKLSTNTISIDKRLPTTPEADVSEAQIETSFYVPLIQQCTELKSLPMAESLHAHIVKTGTIQDVFISTSLVNAYMKCGSFVHAQKLFDQIPERNVVTWTALITGYVHNSKPKSGIEVFVQLLDSGYYPTNYTLGSVLSACTSLRSVEIGEQVHGYIVKYGLELDTSIGNSLCSLYSKSGSLELAEKAFRRIREKNVISWTTIVSACGDNGDTELGLRLFVDMLLENVKPNEFTLTSAMSLCCMVPAFAFGKQIFSKRKTCGWKTCTTLR